MSHRLRWAKKWENIIKGLYPNHMHIFIPCRKTSAKFQNIPWKTARGFAPTRYSVYFHLKGYGLTKWQNHRMMEGQGKSSIAPLFRNGAITSLEIHDYMLYKLTPMQEALGNKSDHVIKMVKVNSVSSFEQIWFYLSTRCCILGFKVIGPLVP